MCDMEQHTYDNESVQELLDWAKKMVETNNYPTERFKINKCTTNKTNKINILYSYLRRLREIRICKYTPTNLNN